jgi:hypothetical protein
MMTGILEVTEKFVLVQDTAVREWWGVENTA